jgi:hypothetical protein
MPNLTKDEVLRLLGATPEAIGKELGEFAAAAKVLSSNHPRLIDEHPMEWVGVFQGRVAATAKDFDALMAQLTARGVPLHQTIVRFIDTEEKTLLL